MRFRSRPPRQCRQPRGGRARPAGREVPRRDTPEGGPGVLSAPCGRSSLCLTSGSTVSGAEKRLLHAAGGSRRGQAMTGSRMQGGTGLRGGWQDHVTPRWGHALGGRPPNWGNKPRAGLLDGPFTEAVLGPGRDRPHACPVRAPSALLSGAGPGSITEFLSHLQLKRGKSWENGDRWSRHPEAPRPRAPTIPAEGPPILTTPVGDPGPRPRDSVDPQGCTPSGPWGPGFQLGCLRETSR